MGEVLQIQAEMIDNIILHSKKRDLPECKIQTFLSEPTDYGPLLCTEHSDKRILIQ